ncbi:hypothetical protein [Derxia gummosa]|uniref:Uncharacterized protein n=1 Tax=Derxia gummosa DSM 723 TaxID=1121388 RepID=A0A8B6X9P4_9BURK|nr:hypothetical protein [Derxia gummosa]
MELTMDAVPAKTAAGKDEVAGRRLNLSRRERNLLLLADGQRSVAELIVMTGSPDLDAVSRLLDEGLLECREPVAPAPQTEAPVQPAAPEPRRNVLIEMLRDSISTYDEVSKLQRGLLP